MITEQLTNMALDFLSEVVKSAYQEGYNKPKTSKQ